MGNRSYIIVRGADFSPNSKYLALGYLGSPDNGALQLWSTNFVPIGQPIEEQSTVFKVKISPDGRYAAARVLSEDYKTKIKLWEFSWETEVLNDWSSLLNQACERIKSHSRLNNPTTQTEKMVVKTCKIYAKDSIQ